jgi:hypothetical protein
MMVARRVIRTTAAAAAVLTLGLVGFAMTNDGPTTSPTPRPSPLRSFSVPLLGTASDIKGIAVPAHILAGERPRYFQIDSPSVARVALPGGKVVSLPVKTAFVNTQVDFMTQSAVVVDVDLLPLPKSVSFREAVAELRRCMKAIDITPDEQMRRQMAAWPDDAPGHDPEKPSNPLTRPYRTGVDLSESVAFEVVVRPADDGGWFLALTLAAAGDARRAVRDPDFKAKVKPPAEEKGKGSGQGSGKK